MKYVSRVKEVIAEIKAKAEEARIEAAEELGVIARRDAPVVSGELRDSMTVIHSEEVSEVGFTAPHAPYVALGTSRQSANHFFEVAGLVEGPRIFKEKLVNKLKEIK